MAKEKKATKVTRRKFLKGATLAGTMLTLPSLVSKASIQEETPMQQIINKVLNEAIKTTNMKAAVEKYGASLSREVKNILQSLTPSDLMALRSIKSKLAPLGSGSGADLTVRIGIPR
jgi:hypothetical protein